MRTESSIRMANGGFLHRGNGTNGATAEHVVEKPPRLINWSALTEFYRQKMTPAKYSIVAGLLGVTVEALVRLRVGNDGTATTWPMQNEKGHIIGIRRRPFDGSRKTCVQGSRSGMFVPIIQEPEGPIFITEGESDCAAILGLGVAAIGRPGCAGGMDYIPTIVGKRIAVLIPDNDAAGSPAMKHTVTSIERLAKELPDLRVAWPVGVKDARAWCAAGLTREKLFERAGL